LLLPITIITGSRIKINKETEPDDKVIREIADKHFNLLKNYPDIMKELKERYFKTI